MKRILLTALGSVVLACTSGCIVAPARPAMVVGPSPVYVEPAYASPGVGWVWEFHPRFGWGWRHPQYGWHRGWR